MEYTSHRIRKRTPNPRIEEKMTLEKRCPKKHKFENVLKPPTQTFLDTTRPRYMQPIRKPSSRAKRSHNKEKIETIWNQEGRQIVVGLGSWKSRYL